MTELRGIADIRRSCHFESIGLSRHAMSKTFAALNMKVCSGELALQGFRTKPLKAQAPRAKGKGPGQPGPL